MDCSNQKKVSDTAIQNNIFTLLAITLFTFGTFTLHTLLASNRIKLVYLIMTLLLLFFAVLVNNASLYLDRIVIMWFVFFIYFLINFLYQQNFEIIDLIDLVVFSFIFMFLALAKISEKNYKAIIRVMFIISIIYGMSAIFQYININLYNRVILPLFDTNHQEEILRLFRNGSYTGFTTQTAYLAGFVVFGLGIIVFSYKNIENNISRFILLVSVAILLFSLFLSGKRAHLLFMIVAVALTFVLSSGRQKLASRIIKILSVFLVATIVLIASSSRFLSNPESQLGKMVQKIMATLEGLQTGEDVTSGRIYLYEYAIQLFSENPILGVGWRSFRDLSIGILHLDRGSHPHNIYIQLLTELGIIGFVLFMIPVIYALFLTVRLTMNYKVFFDTNQQWKFLLQFSLFIQLFFLLYGITGNLLTDHMYLLTYIFAVSITLSSIHYLNNVKLQKH